MKDTLLLRPQYPYGNSQIWMPFDMLNVASRFEAVGKRTTLIDLNLEPLPKNIDEYDNIGIGVIGPPYIPVVRELKERITEQTKKPIFIGGPGVEHLTAEEYERLFPDTQQVANDGQFNKVAGAVAPPASRTGITPAFAQLTEASLRQYLEKEFSFYVSQGCKYACNFCAADRSKRGAPRQEVFSSSIGEDLETICETAKEMNIDTLSMYLSPLDFFQTPQKIAETLEIFAVTSEYHDISFNLRGLARINSFLAALQEEPTLRETIPRAGLKTVGFGVDGTSEKVWKSQHKGNASLSQVNLAYKQCNELGITAEALLVMGFHDENGEPVDNAETLKRNVTYALESAEHYGVIARPHVAKDMVPGNNGWKNPVWQSQKERLLTNPNLFKNLDYVALASELTHPDREFRDEVNDAYLAIIQHLTPIGKCVTTPLLPYTGHKEDDRITETFNMLVPFDK